MDTINGAPRLPNPNQTKTIKGVVRERAFLYPKHWENLLWEVTKGGIGDKGIKYNPESKSPIQGTWTIKGDEIISEPKTLEVGKWYKSASKIGKKYLLFMFMGEFGNGKAIGFDAYGEYSDGIGVHENKIPKYTEAKPEEVIEAFIYHMETFANKRKDIKTAELRDVLNQFHREEISFSKVVELVNKGGK